MRLEFKRIKRWRTLFHFLGVLTFFESAAAKELQQEGRIWNDLVIEGAFAEDSVWRYYFQNSLRLRTQGQGFDENLTRMGLGYELTPKRQIWLGYDLRQAYIGDGFLREQRVWQQLTENLLLQERLRIDSRTRLEERFLQEESQTALRLRQRVQFKFPIFKSDRYHIILFDEIFFNLNHPDWVAPYAVDQNRVYAGIEFSFKSKLRISLGYMNQFILRPRRDFMNHIALFTASLNI